MSKIAKNRPRPLFLTSGGDYKLQRKAKKLNKFTDGVFYENQTHRKGEDAFRDACVWDTAALKVFSRNGRVRHERALTSELYVDGMEAFYGEPRQMHQVKTVDRAMLLDGYPEKKKAITEASTAKTEYAGHTYLADMLEVRESWHLPSGPEATDGKHIISLGRAVLFEEDWTRSDFPFAFLCFKKKQHGFWGRGLAEQLQNIQREINRLLVLIQRSFHMAGSFKILVENGSKVVKSHLNNEVGTIINYTGTPPQYIVPGIVPPEIFQHLLTLKAAAFELAGISMLSAASQKPAGLNSGKALREFNDIESDRFQSVGKAYENFFLDVARLSIATVKEIAEEHGKSYEVKVPGKRFIETVDWKDIDLDDDQFVMQCYPVSSLPNDPAGRLETIQEYMQAGLLSPRQGKRLLDFPDLDAVEGLQNAEEDRITEVLEKIVEEGEAAVPEPYDDLSLSHEMALEFYSQARTQGVEPERLELLRTFITQVQHLMAAAMPPAPAPMPGAPGVEPQAAAAPPPQSDLIPNAPGLLQ